MAFGHQWLSRTVAAALLLLGGIGVPAGSASAADTGPKLTFDLTGTTIPLGVSNKRVYLKITNLGDKTPSEILFNVQNHELDWARVSPMWPTGATAGECDGDLPGWYCRITPDQFPELLPAPGETVDVPIDIWNQRREPYEGRFLVILGDLQKWYTLKVVDDPEADLSVVAPDVKQSARVGADGRLEPTGALNPGETGAVRYRIVNQGRKAVIGLKITLHLPEDVTFTKPPSECVLGDTRRSAVCTYHDLTLVPVKEDTHPDDEIHSAIELYNLVTVAASTKAPVTLKGGTVQVEGLTETEARSHPAATNLPANAIAVPAADVDESDNQDGFAVVLAANSGGGGGGGELPTTGPQVGLLAGVGLIMLAAGGTLLLVTRRRRVIPVTTS